MTCSSTNASNWEFYWAEGAMSRSSGWLRGRLNKSFNFYRDARFIAASPGRFLSRNGRNGRLG